MVTHWGRKDTVTSFDACCAALGWKMYGLKKAYFDFNRDMSGTIPISDPEV
jgi:hypothetical protein